jgi:phosphotransferase system HPr-like phosphotransfer protein
MKRTICISDIRDITSLCHQAQSIKGAVDVSKGKYCVDACSLMGLLSIDLSTGADIEYPDDAASFDSFCSLYEVK